MAMTLAELRAVPDDQLIKLHDELAPLTGIGLGYYQAEIARRDADRQTQEMTHLTKEMHRMSDEMRWMTKVILWATILAVVASVASLVVSLSR